MECETLFVENQLYQNKVDECVGELLINESNLRIDQFHDYTPIENTNYFENTIDNTIEENTDKSGIPTLIIGIVFYNEDVAELIRTIVSLEQQIKEIRDLCKIQIVIVGDGVKQMDPSIAEFFKQCFCKNANDILSWDTMIDNLHTYEKTTCIIQRRLTGDGQDTRTCVKFPTSNHVAQMPLTLILKSENRRKHNSQEWILNSYCKYAFPGIKIDDSRFVMMTDCGTLFEDNCIRKMLNYMISHSNCVGCTGRQRVMSARQQDAPLPKLADNPFKRFLYWVFGEDFLSFLMRAVQCIDYEVSYATYTGAFAGAGCLPVLPGPCSFFRYNGLLSRKYDSRKMIEESALSHYNSLVATNVQETNICIENVKLAEDRIPSYSIITHGEKGAYTTWVDGATFRFQAELSLEKLILQRRRWINGALSCYAWNTVVNPGQILKSRHNFFRKAYIYMLYWLQLLNYVIAMCTYGVIGGSIYISLLSLFNLDFGYTVLITCIYMCIVISHLIVHKYVTFSKLFTVLVMIINTLAMCFVLTGYIYAIVDWGGLGSSNVGRLLIEYSTIVVFALPLVMALISMNLKSIVYILFGYILYWLFLPTLCGTFVLYSVARLSDITWGNRESAEKSR
jgi:cellulose synthase/poly-beta-1,6-N-acetylglucosamine synthase-like glycosyltransferase